MKTENDIKSMLGTKQKFLNRLQKQIRKSISENNDDIDFLRKQRILLNNDIQLLNWILN